MNRSNNYKIKFQHNKTILTGNNYNVVIKK